MLDRVVSVDVGGTTMRAALVTRSGEILRVERRPTAEATSVPEATAALVAALEPGPVDRVVIGLPGRVDYRSGRLEHAPNLPPAWVPDLTEARLSGALGCDVVVANDADLAAVGEAVHGAGAGHRDVVYLTISTGVGAGVVVDGNVLAGARSMAEIGHTIIDLSAARAGGPATVEGIGSGSALARTLAAGGFDLEGSTITDLADRDPAARDVVVSSLAAAAAGAVNLVHLFAADVVVVGGGIGSHADLVLPLVVDLLERHGPRGLPEPVAVVSAALGDDAGLVGGAAWRRPLHAG